METLEKKIWEHIDAYSDIPNFIKERLFALVPHSEEEFIERCLAKESKGAILNITHGICPTCKKIEKLNNRNYLYEPAICEKCGTSIKTRLAGQMYCTEFFFSKDNRLVMPTFFKITCEYIFSSKDVNIEVLTLNQKEGLFSDFVKRDNGPYSLGLEIKRIGPSDESLINEFKSVYPHSGYDFYIKVRKSLSYSLSYCMLYIRYPQIELLIKTKYSEIIYELLYSKSSSLEYTFKRNFKQGTNLKEILPAPEWIMNPKLSLSEMNDARILYSKYRPSKESFERFLELNLRKSEIKIFKQILTLKFHGNPLYTFDKLISYIGRCDMYQAIYPYDCVIILRDYLNMCISMDTLPDVNSNSLKREHDIAARNFNLIVDKIIEDNFIQKAKELKIYEYENKKYKVLVPKTPQELINEGKNNRNCVGSYVKSFSEGNSKIFFIRDKKHIDSSYVTLEMRGSCITQAYLSANRTITDKPTLDFIAEWQNHLINKKIIREHSE